MKKINVITGIVVVLALLVAASLFQGQALAGDEQLPFKASGPEYVVQEGPHLDCSGNIKVEVSGSGQGTFVGSYTIERTHCVDIATGAIFDGSFVQTASNGDQLWGTYTGSLAGILEVDQNGNPVVVLIESPYQITGGSGRFAGAEGEGMTTAEFNFVEKVGDFDNEGWITFEAGE